MTGQLRAMLALLHSEPKRGFDASELARRLGTSTHGASRTAASLVKHGHADRFIGGVGVQRVHWQAAEATR